MKMSLPVIVGFLFGVVAVLTVEALLILYVIRRLTGDKTNSKSSSSDDDDSLTAVSSHSHPLDPHHSLSSVYQKQGVVWILEPEKVPKVPTPAEQARKKEIVEVSPVRRLAKIKDRILYLAEADGSFTKILLKGCLVVAISATSLPTRKWAKRFPIKVESKSVALYRGNKVLYFYAETSWEKESWCKALRLASSDDNERLLWFSKLNEEFRCYLKSLSEGYPSLIKPSAGFYGGPQDKVDQLNEHPSKVRQFFKKLSKKASMSSHDDKKAADRSRSFQTPVSFPGNSRTAISGKTGNGFVEDSCSVSSAALSHCGSSTNISEISDADVSEKFVVDEGTLCWNLLMSRMFFDAKNNADIRTVLKARIQRTLSNMRTPSYIGEVICTDVDPGNLPPYIHGMRAVPTDMNDLWAMELDVEYSGGVVLYIEARLEMGELELHNGMTDSNIPSGSVGEVPTDVLEDFKHLQEELKLSDGVADSPELKNNGDQKVGTEKLKSSKTGLQTATTGSRWKSLLNSVAKHVSQVPLALAIRVATLKGTIQLHIKSPPSDQLWFGFTSMPDITFQLESSVRDHKITSARIASFLINRFKASIRETLVLPNCESACVPWMLAEKDDWIPRNIAPFMWINRETPSDSTSSNEGSKSSSNNGQKAVEQDQENKHVKQKKVDFVNQSIREDGVGMSRSTSISRTSSESSIPSQDLRTPLLQNEEARDWSIIPRKEDNSECQSPSRYVSLREQRNSFEDEDGKHKRWGVRRTKMLDLGKKMGEKFEEKRRHIEEKSRHIVEKMRGHDGSA